MRKTLLTLILAVVSSACAWVHAQTIVLSESFENGMPASWTQENVIGSTSWTTEVATAAVDLTYPAGTASGVGRAVLRNETGETQGYKTRLITPWMNLDTIFQPILRYYHAQMKWTADFDTLRVLYRNSKGGEWQVLQEFTQPIQRWTKEELDLPQPSTEYQLCFEGTDNLGRGIVLDSVMVRSKPECTIPHDMSLANMSDNGVTLLWQASYDASKYDVVLIKSDEVLDIDTLSETSKEALVVVDTTITGFTFQCRFTNLEPKTNYVAYVRSICDMENSSWGVFPFFMKAVKNIPYYENFDMVQNAGTLHRISGWTYGNNTGNFNPFINTHQSEADAKAYVMSGTALCFTGGNNVGSGFDIPAGLYVYAASPELNVESIQPLQVRFWGSLGKYGSMSDNARAIIVGVMEDAEDITSFVPVDTMKLWKFATYEEHITSFANYTGEGKVIAFASYFDQPNQFYIDDMTVEYAPAVAKVSGVNAIPAITEATISWNNVAAPSYSLLISTDYTTQVDTLSAVQKVVDTKVNAATNYTAKGLTEGTKYYVYVKAEGSQEWSNAVDFTTSCKRAIPMVFGFEEYEGIYSEYNERNNTTNKYPACVQIYSTDVQFPRCISGSSYRHSGDYGFYHNLPVRRDAWIVFPYVDTLIQGVEIEFYMKSSSTSYKNTAIEIGVMEDPDDINTFESVALAQNGTTTWKRFYANFTEYKGAGKYIALRWAFNEAGGATGTYANSYPYIDDVLIQKLGDCITPKLEVEEVTMETATLSWTALNMTQFQVIIDSLATRDEKVLDEITLQSEEEWADGIYYMMNVKDTTAITLPKEKLRPGRTYYAYIRSVCDSAEYSYWSAPLPFTLLFPEILPIPYTETFEGFGDGSGTMAAGWTRADKTKTYPYLYGTYKHTGEASLYMYYSTSSTELYAPLFEIDDMSNMLISLWGRASSAASATYVDSLYIGVGNNPDDPNDVITWLDTISIPTTAFTKYRTRLAGWQPSMGRRVVFSTLNAKSNTLYLDDITFESIFNATPYDMEVLDVTDVEARFTWEGEATKGWTVVVTKESVNPDSISTLDPSVVVCSEVTTTKPFVVTGLSAQTNYYAYVKPVEGNAEWSEELNILTQCLKLKPSRQFKMTFEDLLPKSTTTISSFAKSTFPDCWVRHGADENASSISYTPYIYQYSTTSNITPTSYVHDGLASAKIYTSTSKYPAWFTTPDLAAKNMSNVTVKFWARASSAAYEMQFGVMVDPDDPATFTKLADIKPGVTAWIQYSFLLEEYGYKPEMGTYIAFMQNQPKAWTYYIDDIEINESTCRPANPLLSKLTHNSVRMTYSPEPVNMRIVMAKDYKLNADSLNVYDSVLINKLKTQGVILMDSIVSGQMGIPFTALESNTDYSVALLTICEDDITSWVTTSWTTMCDPTPVNDSVFIDFEAGYNDTTLQSPGTNMRPIPCWITGSKSKAASQTNIPYVLKGTVAPAGEKSLKFHSTTSNNGAYAIMPAMDVDSITKYELSFLGRAVGGTTTSAPTYGELSSTYKGAIIVGVVTDPSDLSTFVGVDTVDLDDNAVHKCKVRFSSYKGDANDEYGKFVAFLSEFNSTNIFYVDNLSFAKIDPCGEPLSIGADSIGISDALIAWNGTTSSYRVVLSEEPLEEAEWENYKQYIVDDTVSTTSYQVRGLRSNTQYFVYVKALCDGGEGKWNLQGTNFVTDCATLLSLPYEEDFDHYTSSSTKNPPACWTTFNKLLMNTDASYPSVYSSAKYGSAGNGLYWYIATADTIASRRPTIATLPVEDISKVMISFKLKCSASAAKPSMLALGYATDISCIDSLIATVQYVDTVYPGISSTEWVEYARDMKDAQGTNVYIVLSQLYGSASGTYLYMDDFKVEKTPTCFTPSAEVLETTYDEVILGITPFLEGDKAWDVMLVSEDYTDTVMATVDTTTATVGGLMYSTNYNMYVRTNCGEGDVSEWSDPLYLSTKYKIGDGTFYSFEKEDGAVRTPISTSDTYVAHPSLYIGENNGTTNASYMPYQVVQTGTAKKARTGDASMQFYATSASFYQAWMALPMILGEDSLQMRFDMRAATVNGGDTILDTNNYSPIARFQVGVIDDDYDLDSYEVLVEYKPSTLVLRERVTEEKNLLFDQIVVPLPKDLTGKRIVLMNPTNAYSAYVFVDNLRLEKKLGWQTPTITTSTVTPTSLTIDWNAAGSDKWNVYLTQSVANFPLANIPAEDIVAKQEGLTTPTATFVGLDPNTEYYVYVQVAGQNDIAASSPRRIFKTPMDVKISTDSIITFEGVHNTTTDVDMYALFPYSTTKGDTLYAMSMGWYTGNMSSVTRSHRPWARLNGYSVTSSSAGTSYDGIKVAYQGERALQLYSAATNNQLGAYAVMPEVDGDYDTLQVNFYARPFYEGDAGKVGIAGSTYKNKPLVVGTMTDPNNPATFVAIDSLYYEDISLTTSSEVAPLYRAGFQYYSFRLANAVGKYIAFSAPVLGQWYIDNISFSEKTCLPPNGLKVNDITKNSAVFTWDTQDDNDCVVQLSKAEGFADAAILFVDTVPAGTKVQLSNLESVTTYYVRVRELCSADNESTWAMTSFTTECYETSGNFTCGFEISEGHVHQGSSTSSTYDIAQCWTTGTTANTTSWYMYVPRVQASSSTFYSRNTVESNLQSTSSLRMYAYASSSSTSSSTSYYDQWAVMPRFDMEAMDTDTIQLEFYALAGAYNPTKGTISSSYTGDTYLPSIVVGVMSDPNDISTFVALDTCTYDLAKLTTSTVAIPENEFMFQRFVVPLKGIKGKGDYLAFKTYLIDWIESQPTRPASSMYTQIYLDDVSMQKFNECYIPDNLEASDIMVSTATLSWTGDEGASWIVNLSTDPLFQDPKQAILDKDTVTEMTIHVEGLDTMTTYYWNVQQICGPKSMSMVSQTAVFKTAYVPLFHEEFLNTTTIPVDWARDTTRACYLFNGAPLKGVGTSYAWSRTTAAEGLSGAHMYAPMNSGSPTSTTTYLKKSWLVTPTIYLDTEKEAWLTFYAALAHYNYTSNTVADQNGWDDQFMVVISEDGGVTWKRENATIWNNETSNDPTDSLYVYGKGDYVLNDLPYLNDRSMPYSISLAKYKGKGIKVGFYCESSVLNAYNELHIGDAHINYVDYVVSEATSCQFEDLVSPDGEFYIDGDQIEAGTHEFKKIELATLNDLRENPNDRLVDTMFVFTAHFEESPDVVIEKTICEGEVAGAEWGFQDHSQSGIYRRKGVSAVTGCDSITTFQLTVIPRQRTEEVVQICKGTSYEFNGKFYNETGVYVDTLTSVVTGCDSITTLLLTVNPPLTHEYSAYTCTGSTYYFTEKYPALTASGKYVDTLQTAEGCDSIVTLNLTVSEMIDIQIYDTVCEGTSYLFEGKAYDKPGKYEFEYTSVVGCDSIVTLNLAWRDIDTIVVDTMIYDSELPYIYPNADLTYPKGTQPGVYVDTLSLSSDDNECGYVLVHKLTITMSTAVGNISASDIVLQPSIIELGESVTIRGLGSEPVMVYVYDMVGHCVAQQSMSGNSIEVNAFNNAGVYMVRVSNTSGEQFVGRVIVK
ncbi:MAG: choice-of-anchor J domain-containing protein [Paludibacteraceae bacterium]|nr:choice-of-anchor J domain-containing protein [Paludibacteraceae bacterium]